MTKRIAVFVALSILGGCGREAASANPAASRPTEVVVPVEAVSTADPARPSAEDGGAATDLGRAEPAPDAMPPPLVWLEPPRLGEACAPPDGGAYSVTLACDGKGRVAGIWYDVDSVTDVPPSNAEILTRGPTTAKSMMRSSLTVGAVGERLYVNHVTCAACARVMGKAFVGDLPKLGDEDLRRLQEEVGLSRDPVLRTKAAWRAALARRKVTP